MSTSHLSPSQAPVVRVSKRRTHQVTTAMAAFMLAGLGAPTALADGGQGGGGAAGGVDTTGNFGNGGANGSGPSVGGGGGGAGALEGGPGGLSTDSGGGFVFGTAGIPGGGPGASGGNGANGALSGQGGGGGAGASHAYVGAAFPGAPAVGGNGGAGGAGFDAGGGGGGAGGYGLIITGDGALGALIDPATGGNGGLGGDGTASGFGGNGGSGGVGLSFTGASAFTAIINANVTGGNGGIGGSGDTGATGGVNGPGGVGLIATGDATLTLGATVSGGLSGGQRANAIQFLGTTNQLTLNVGGAVVGGISTAGDLTLLQFTDTTFANNFSGAGRLIIDGGGVVTLSGDNTQSGGTVVNAGVLQIASGSALSPSFLGTAVNSGAILRFTNTAPALVTGGVSGAGNVQLRGTAPVTLGPVNLTGTLDIGAGSALTLQTSFFGPNTLNTVINNGAMTIDGGAQFSTGSSGAGTLALTGGTFFSPGIITGVHTHTGGTSIASGAIVRIGAAGGVVDTIAGAINNSGLLTYVADSSAANTTITSTSQLTFSDNSTLGNASIIIASGTGSIGGNADGGTSAWTLQGSSGLSILDSTRTTASGFRGVTIGSLASSSATSTVSIGGYPELPGGPGRELTIGSNNQSTTFAGIIQNGGDSNSGPGSLVKIGTGTLTLTGANTFNGGTTINGGVLNVSSDGNLGGAAGGLSFGGGTLRLGASFNVGGTRAVTMNTGGGTIDTNGFNTSISQAINGVGSLTKIGAGALTLGGANGFTGGAAINGGTVIASSDANLGGPGGALSFAGGTLQLGAAFNVGSGRAITLNTGGGTIDTNGFNSTISQAINGVGGLTKVGAGTLTLGGANGFTGGAAINGGTVIASSDANLGGPGGALSFAGGTLQLGGSFNVGGTRAVTLNTGGGTIDTNGFNTTIGQAITGAGSLTKVGAGTLTLGGASMFTGGTAINGGVVNASSDGNFGGAAGGLSFAGGTLQLGSSFNVAGTRAVTLSTGGGTIDTNGFNTTIGQAITGAGSLTKTGTGTLTLGGASTFTGGTSINGGVVNASSDGNFGGAAGGLSFAGGTLQLGSSFNVAGTRAVTLNTGGGTIDTNGFNTTIGQAMTGAGSLTKSGTGTLTLGGTNTYAGGTAINGGVVVASSDTNFGATAGALSFNGGTLRLASAFNVASGRAMTVNAGGATFDSNGFNSTISQGISGTGAFRKDGLGTLILTGASTFSGATTVAGGTLLVNGSLASPVTVASGATLGGSGSVGALTVNGILSPGNSPGVITVNGNLTLSSSSVYLVEILQGTADRTNVTGTAALGGTLRLVALGAPYTFGTPYVILSAAGGLGGTTFTTLDSAANAFGAGVRPTVVYTANEVRLTLSAAELPTTGLTNARNAAGGINAAVAGGANPDSFFPLFNLAAPAIPAALNTVSGEVHAAVNAVGFQANDQFLRVMLDPFAPSARVENGHGLTAWVAPFGLERTVEGDGSVIGSAENTVTTSNIAFGIDAALHSHLRVGASASTGNAQTKLAQQRGKAEAEVTQFGAYATATVGPAKLGAALSFSDYEIETTRVIPVFANAVLRGKYGADAWGARIEGEAAISSFAGATLSALGAYRTISLDTSSFAERAVAGGGFAGANGVAREATSSRTELGLKLETDTLFDANWRGYAQASWAHALEGDYDATLSLAGLAGSRFTVFAAEPTEDTLLLRAGLSGSLNERVTLSGRLEGETGDGVSEFGAILQARIGF